MLFPPFFSVPVPTNLRQRNTEVGEATVSYHSALYTTIVPAIPGTPATTQNLKSSWPTQRSSEIATSAQSVLFKSSNMRSGIKGMYTNQYVCNLIPPNSTLAVST